MAKSVSMRVVFRPLKNEYGYVVFKSASRCEIHIDNRSSPATQIGTLFHEFVHVAFNILFKDLMIDEKKEHAICRRIDKVIQTSVLKYFKGDR